MKRKLPLEISVVSTKKEKPKYKSENTALCARLTCEKWFFPVLDFQWNVFSSRNDECLLRDEYSLGETTFRTIDTLNTATPEACVRHAERDGVFFAVSSLSVSFSLFSFTSFESTLRLYTIRLHGCDDNVLQLAPEPTCLLQLNHLCSKKHILSSCRWLALRLPCTLFSSRSPCFPWSPLRRHFALFPLCLPFVVKLNSIAMFWKQLNLRLPLFRP